MLDELERGSAGAVVVAAQEQTRAVVAIRGATAPPGGPRGGRAGARRVEPRRLERRRDASAAGPRRAVAPADKDLAWSSPAVLAGSPRAALLRRDATRAAP